MLPHQDVDKLHDNLKDILDSLTEFQEGLSAFNLEDDHLFSDILNFYAGEVVINPKFEDILTYLGMNISAKPSIMEPALAYAIVVHDHKERKTGGYFVTHPIEIATQMKAKGADDVTIAGALMHDCIEEIVDMQHIEFDQMRKDIRDDLLADFIYKFQISLKNWIEENSHEPEEKTSLESDLAQLGRFFSQHSKLDSMHYFEFIDNITDPRVIWLKLEDRLHNSCTMDTVYVSQDGELGKLAQPFSTAAKLRQVFKNIYLLNHVRDYLVDAPGSEYVSQISRTFGSISLDGISIHTPPHKSLAKQTEGKGVGLVYETYQTLANILDELYDPADEDQIELFATLGKYSGSDAATKVTFPKEGYPFDGTLVRGYMAVKDASHMCTLDLCLFRDTLTMLSIMETYYTSPTEPNRILGFNAETLAKLSERYVREYGTSVHFDHSFVK